MSFFYQALQNSSSLFPLPSYKAGPHFYVFVTTVSYFLVPISLLVKILQRNRSNRTYIYPKYIYILYICIYIPYICILYTHKCIGHTCTYIGCTCVCVCVCVCVCIGLISYISWEVLWYFVWKLEVYDSHWYKFQSEFEDLRTCRRSRFCQSQSKDSWWLMAEFK